MRLVLLTQVLDRRDAVLGFFHRWCEVFAEHVDELVVIAQQVGDVDLPGVEVRSLGRERGAGRGAMLVAMLGALLAQRGRRRPTAIWAHMVPRFALCAATVALPRRIPLYLWYTHKGVDRSLKLATPLVRKVFTASAESYRYAKGAPKRVVTGHGIDCQLFAPPDGPRPVDVVTVGRLAPSKAQHELLAALALLPGVPRTEIAGDILLDRDAGYRDALAAQARELGDAVRFLGAVAHPDMAATMGRARVLVNASRTGSVDKVVLEAMATGTLPLTCNESFEPLFGPELAIRLMYPPGDVRALAARLSELLALDDPARRELGQHLRGIVRRDHDLDRLIPRMLAAMEPGS